MALRMWTGLTRQVKEVRGKTVILCAQAMESTRILLNSSTRGVSERVGEFERGAGSLFDGPRHGWRGWGRVGKHEREAERERAGPAERNLHSAIQEFAVGEESVEFIRGYGFQGSGGAVFNFGAVGMELRISRL